MGFIYMVDFQMKTFSIPFIPLVLCFNKREKEHYDHFMIDLTFVIFGKRYDIFLEEE